jgi:phosphoenolpyruvate-protein kinase (PTS system EI component)
MAGDVRYARLLVGLGYTLLSMSSYFIPQVKRVIRSISLDEARTLANKALSLTEVKKIKMLLQKGSTD